MTKITFHQLEKRAAKIRAVELWRGVDNILDVARSNADDTIYVDREAKPYQWNEIAVASIGSLLSEKNYTTEAVRRWFRKVGLEW